MRKLVLTFPKSETLSHQLTWSLYFGLLKCDDPMEIPSWLYADGKSHASEFYVTPMELDL